MQKKNLIYILVLMLFSCNDQLNLEPISEIGENGYFNNADEVEAGLVAAYDGLQTAIQREIFILENRSDNGKVGGGSGGDFLAIETFDDKPVSSIITPYWGAMYNAISRTNLVLKHVGVVENEDLRKQFEGEARFMRAYLYFKLVRMFGEVPLVLESIEPENKEVLVRKPVEEVYAAIIADLEFAAANLSPVSDEKRPAALAAKGLLGKVYLTLHDYEKAGNLLKSVIDSDAFALESSYGDVFDLGNELNDELLFVIQFKSGSNGEGNGFSYELTPQSPIGAVRPTTDMMAAYTAEDLRKEVSLSEADKLILKYQNENILYDGENDWPVLRYADVLLMYGEVLNETNPNDQPTQSSLDYLNMTRERAGLTALTTDDIATKEEYRAAIATERRLELAFENHRWFDLLRTGKALEVMQAHGAEEGFQVQSFRLLFPIPQREIDTSNGILTQNSGYQ